MRQTVFVIDDDPDIVNTLCWLIKSVEIPVETFHGGEEFLSVYEACKKKGGCIILDVRLKGMSGLKVQEALTALKNQIPIIFLTGHGDAEMATMAMKRGAMDFFLKPFNNQQLLDAIHSALEENARRVRILGMSEKIKKRKNKLSLRELTVMKMIVQGKLNKTTAHELGISLSTVEAHRAKIMEKMEVSTLAELIKISILYDLCEMD